MTDQTLFYKDFTPEILVSSPGRINLIGEHTDYNLGYVLPMAIDKKISFKMAKNGHASLCSLHSTNLEATFSVNLNNIKKSKVQWENYINGVLFGISKITDGLAGFNCIVESNLPSGSGLSSSAALECGLATGLNSLFNLGLRKEDIIKISQKAEHDFVGTQCGIMDQFASVMGENNKVILLDCKTLDYEYVPFDLGLYKIVLINTHVSHNLASSEYNKRRSQCEKIVALVSKKYVEITSLRDVTMDILNEFKNELDDNTYNKGLFIIQENERVLELIEILKKGGIKEMAPVLFEAHEGLSKLYEVSCDESDFLVSLAKESGVVYGSRQMGGGFGGCTLNIVHEDDIDAFIKNITPLYKEKFQLDLSYYIATPAQGTTITELV